MNYKLPPELWSWAWTSRLIRSRSDDVEMSPGGILVPRTEPVDDTPAIAHFAEMSPEGAEIAWLWLFASPNEARQLRLLQQFSTRVEPRDINLIGDTLPMAPPGEPDPCYLQNVPVSWLAENLPPDIREVWIGFNFKSYVSDRKLRFSAQILSATEFRAIAAR